MSKRLDKQRRIESKVIRNMLINHKDRISQFKGGSEVLPKLTPEQIFEKYFNE